MKKIKHSTKSAQLIDGGIFVGSEPKYGLALAPELISELSLFCDFSAIYHDMFDGNKRTLEIARENPMLIPMAVVNPLHYDSASGYMSGLKKAGFACIGFFRPLQDWNTFNFSYRSALLDAVKTGLPIQIGVSTPEDLYFAVEVIGGTKSDVLIRHLGSSGYIHLADQIAIAKKYRNIFFDVSNMVLSGGIETLAEAIGASRLYCASNKPLYYPSCTRYLLQYGNELSAKTQSAIKGGTLAGVFPKWKSVKRTGLEIVSQSSIGRPKIDTHWHIDGWDILEPGKSASDFNKLFDKFGYEAACVSSIQALRHDLIAGNEATRRAIESNERLFGYVVVSPTETERSIELLESYVSHPKFVGIKTIQDHYGPNVFLNDQRYEAILKWAEKFAWPVMAHIGGMREAAANYPSIQFIAAHVTLDRLTKLLNSSGGLAKNIYLDIATSTGHRGASGMEALVEKAGSDRVLFSTDGTVISPAWTIGKIDDSNFSEETQCQVYLENARRLFPKLQTMSKVETA